jgi:type IV secretory pathway VirB10-like protein
MTHLPIPRARIGTAIAALLLACTTLAHAQFMWIDARGIKQYSDQPPPPSVPLKDIKKAPKSFGLSNPPVEAVAAATAAPSSALAPKGAPSLAERNADYNKRQKDKMEADKKDAEEKAQRVARADNCERLRANKATLDSGARVRTTDKNGETTVMDDAARALEQQRIDKNLAACKAG